MRDSDMTEEINTEFLPCPRCNSDKVEWTNTRDLNVLTSEVYCRKCGLSTFNVQTVAFELLPNLDYETSLMKYNAWVKTDPNSWREDTWEKLI